MTIREYLNEFQENFPTVWEEDVEEIADSVRGTVFYLADEEFVWVVVYKDNGQIPSWTKDGLDYELPEPEEFSDEDWHEEVWKVFEPNSGGWATLRSLQKIEKLHFANFVVEKLGRETWWEEDIWSFVGDSIQGEELYNIICDKLTEDYGLSQERQQKNKGAKK